MNKLSPADQRSRKKWSASCIHSWWILKPTWFDFGKILAAKLELCWDHMPPTFDFKTKLKKYYFLEDLRIDFGSSLASKRGSKMLKFFVDFRSWALLGPCWAQDRPRPPKTPNLEPKWHPRPPNLELKYAPTTQTWSHNGPKTPNLEEKVTPATLNWIKGCSQHPKAHGRSP